LRLPLDPLGFACTGLNVIPVAFLPWILLPIKRTARQHHQPTSKYFPTWVTFAHRNSSSIGSICACLRSFTRNLDRHAPPAAVVHGLPKPAPTGSEKHHKTAEFVDRASKSHAGNFHKETSLHRKRLGLVKDSEGRLAIRRELRFLEWLKIAINSTDSIINFELSPIS
jgi:hypothetical protein